MLLLQPFDSSSFHTHLKERIFCCALLFNVRLHESITNFQTDEIQIFQNFRYVLDGRFVIQNGVAHRTYTRQLLGWIVVPGRRPISSPIFLGHTCPQFELRVTSLDLESDATTSAASGSQMPPLIAAPHCAAVPSAHSPGTSCAARGRTLKRSMKAEPMTPPLAPATSGDYDVELSS